MSQFTAKQLRDAEEILRKESKQKEVADAKELAVELLDFFSDTIRRHYCTEPIDNEWISKRVLAQVVEQSIRSQSDFRHRYPFSVSAIKYISIVAFWITKLKPVNGLGLRKDGEYIDCEDINERLAIRWIIKSIFKFFRKGKISELLPYEPEREQDLAKIFLLYTQGPMYLSATGDSEPDTTEKNVKSYETAYYMRFKKMTAINIYESLIHLLLPLRAQYQSETSS